LGAFDTGIDLVGLTNEGDYWAIQCKCYDENTVIDKKAVNTFISTSGRSFKDVDSLKTVSFSQRLWVSTTNKWTNNATESLRNQNPPIIRLNIHDLVNAPVDWEKLENNITGELARNKKYPIKEHQKIALEQTHKYFKEKAINPTHRKANETQTTENALPTANLAKCGLTASFETVLYYL